MLCFARHVESVRWGSNTGVSSFGAMRLRWGIECAGSGAGGGRDLLISAVDVRNIVPDSRAEAANRMENQVWKVGSGAGGGRGTDGEEE
eukprot:3324200-Ditylum_brightwellii.AAC.1